MSLVVDASVAIKWFVTESEHDEAIAIIDFKTDLVTPELFKAEFTNILWKKVIRSEIGLEHAMLAIERVESFVTFFRTSFELNQSALQFAVKLAHPSYDCTYLACAEQLGSKLVTADRKFADKVERAGLGHLVMRLADARKGETVKPKITDEDLQKVLALSARYRETIANVKAQLGASAEPYAIISTRDLLPALDSPVRQKLKTALNGLSEAELVDLIALGWLGRGYDGVDFSALRVQAHTTFSDGPSHNVAYILSILQYVEQGLALLNARHGDE